MTGSKKWIDLSSSGFDVVVVYFSEPEGSAAVAVRGTRALSKSEEEALSRLGFRAAPAPENGRTPGFSTVWLRAGSKFTLSEIKSAFPTAGVAEIEVSRTFIRDSGRSPFAWVPPSETESTKAEPDNPPPAAQRSLRPGLPPPGIRRVQPIAAPQRQSPDASPQFQGADPSSLPPARPAAPLRFPSAPGISRPSAAAPQVKTGLIEVSVEDSETPLFSFEAANKFQARYKPMSRVGSPIAMVPVNMASATRAALERIASEHGDFDEWVAGKLQWDVDFMATQLSPEQVDAVGMIIYAAERNRGFILADQTGLGKGRVLAAVSRVAALNNYTVVFLTEKANLFSDFWRDVRDISSDDIFGTPMLLNSGSKIIDTSSLHGDVLHVAPKNKVLKEIIKSGALPEGCRLVMATYSQFNKQGSLKADFLASVARGSRFISDESHNAVGDSNTSETIGAAMRLAAAVTYSSATFARDANNLAAYAPVLPQSLRDIDLAEMMKAGGQPLQEVLSQALAEDGVLIRREHDLSNIKIVVREDEARLSRNMELSDQLSPILARLAGLARKVDTLAEERNQQNSDHLEVLPSTERKAARENWYTVNFGSRLAAILRQFITALKVDQCAEECVASLLRGEKPVVVIESTMESLMRELAADDAPPGQGSGPEDDRFGTEKEADYAASDSASTGRPPDFRDALNLMLDRMMMLSVKRPDADPEKVEIENPFMKAEAQAIREMIAAFPDLSLSPIDDIRDRIEAEGRRLHAEGVIERPWVADEISARSLRVQDGKYVPMAVRDRNLIISGYNSAKIDALMLTKAASTGLSIHASERFIDQRPRLMIELQIPSNVVERVQFWGRINRRGQVCEPYFLTLSTGLPMEVRILAMQNRKVADLSANVSASADSASAMDVADIIDSVGNEVCKRLLEEYPALADHMSIAMRVDPEKASEELYFVNKLLQRLALLPSAEQTKLYESVLSSYDDAIRELDAKGRHPRKSRELQGGWRVIKREIFEAGNPADGSVFGRPVYLTTIEADSDLSPMSSVELAGRIRNARARLTAEFGGEPGDWFKAADAHINKNRDRILSSALSKHSTVRQALNASGDNAVKTAAARLKDLTAILRVIQPGSPLSVPTEDGEVSGAVVTDIIAPPLEQVHLSYRWALRYALPGDEDHREISIGTLMRDNRMILHASKPGEEIRLSFPQFDRVARGNVTVQRKVLDGNLVSAVRMAHENGYGTAVTFTDAEGRRRRGVLIPKGKQNNISSIHASTRSPDIAFEVIRHGGKIHTNAHRPADGLMIRNERGQAVIEIPFKKTAAKPFETKDLVRATGGFQQIPGEYRYRDAMVPPEKLRDVLAAVIAAGHTFYFSGQHRRLAVASAMESQPQSADEPSPDPAPSM